ncbi:MAG: hypothetical protein WBJ75_13540, partial [Pseudohongiellaceae bacterium]
MKLTTDVTINGKLYPQGKEVPWLMIYPFFMAYSDDGPPILFLYLHGGIAITAYLAFYRQYFGRDEIRWMFINAALGLIGITVEIDWLLSLYGRTVDSYPIYVHVIPFLYYILYTFLLRQAVLDLT